MYVDQFEPWLNGFDVTQVGFELSTQLDLVDSLYPVDPKTDYASSFKAMNERIRIVDRFILKCMKL